MRARRYGSNQAAATPSTVTIVAAAGQEPGGPHGERELGELGRLEDDRSEGDPAPRAVDGRSEDEDGDAQDEAHEDEHRRQLVQRAEADPREDEEEQQPDGGVD